MISIIVLTVIDLIKQILSGNFDFLLVRIYNDDF